MHDALLQRLRDAGFRRPVHSLVVAPSPPAQAARLAPLKGLKVTRMATEHPVPGRGSFRAGRAAHRFMGSARAGDDVVALISGGGSALVAAPLGPFMNAAEKARLHRLLITSGAPIGAINAVRRHLSAVKGGRLALQAARARSLTSLILCDVDPDRYEEVASGPTVPDRTTLDDMVAVIDRYGLAPALPERVLLALRAGRLPETPKPRDPAFRRARAQMLLSNSDLRNAAVRAGLTRGLAAEAMPNEITTPVEEAVELVARAIEGAPTGLRLLVLGGEARTAPAAPGAGGRAQEFALRLALRMRNLSMRGWAFLAAGSDGIDGFSPAAGAFVDSGTLDRAAALRLDPERALQRAETWRLFHRLGDDLVTGPTATNVRDLYLLLTGLPRPGGR
jgi:glycerate-2-kinase